MNRGTLVCSFVLLIASTFQSCNHNVIPSPPATDAEDFGPSHYIRRTNADTVIVFVHGVFGGSVGTWKNPQNGAYWPNLLEDDKTFKNADVYVYSYSTPYLGPSYTIDELIESMRLNLDNDEVFQKHKHVVFLCHSMGGLVVRGFLKRYQARAASVPLIYFFSSPTSGSHIASLAKFLSRNPQLKGMLPANANDYVTFLQHDWRALPIHVNSRCAYETLDTYGIRIVDEQSASALCDGPVDPVNSNHMDIVKPHDRSDVPYIAFREAFQAIRQPEAATPANPDHDKAVQPVSVVGTVQTARSVEGKRLTNTPVRQAGSVFKCTDDRKNRVVSAQATSPCGSSTASDGVCEQRYAAERVLPESRFELQHTGSPPKETALEEKA